MFLYTIIETGRKIPFFFLQLNVVGLLFLLAVTVRVVIVGFPFLFGPHREHGRYTFRAFWLWTPPLLSPPGKDRRWSFIKSWNMINLFRFFFFHQLNFLDLPFSLP